MMHWQIRRGSAQHRRARGEQRLIREHDQARIETSFAQRQTDIRPDAGRLAGRNGDQR
jgi:hypothetical protein